MCDASDQKTGYLICHYLIQECILYGAYAWDYLDFFNFDLQDAWSQKIQSGEKKELYGKIRTFKKKKQVT